jgi:hypothetical protein
MAFNIIGPEEGVQLSSALKTVTRAPRSVPVRVLEFLERSANSKHALERMRLENGLLDELESEIASLRFQIIPLTEQKSSSDLAANQIRADERDRSARAPGRKLEGKSRAEPYESDAADFQRRIDDLERKIASLGARAKPLRERQQKCNTFLSRAREDSRKDYVFLDPPAVTQKMTIDRVRSRGVQLRAALDDAEKAPVPRSVAKSSLLRWINDRAAMINAAPLLGGGEVGVSPPYVPRTLTPASGGRAEIVNSLGLLCWLLKDVLIERLNEQIDRAAKDDVALTDEDRAKRITALKGEILETDRLEETMVFAALRSGEDVDLRGDSDPRAILWVKVT